MEKMFIYWNSGSCNYGDHDTGLEAFDTKAAALARIEELKTAYGRPVYDFTIHVVTGTDVSKLLGFDDV